MVSLPSHSMLPQCGWGELSQGMRRAGKYTSWISHYFAVYHITDGFLQNTHIKCSTALFVMYMMVYIDGLVQDCSISIANALEIVATGDTAVLHQTINMPLLPSHLNAAGVWTGTVIIQGMKRLGKSRSGILSYTAVRVQHCQFSLKYSAPWNVIIVYNVLFSMKAKMCTDKVKATFK